MNTVIFGQIVPGKTQCGKTSAADEGFLFIYSNEKFIYKSPDEQSKICTHLAEFSGTFRGVSDPRGDLLHPLRHLACELCAVPLWTT